jgi:putative acetyltransferase
MPLIEREQPPHHALVRDVHLAAFPTAVEADLVDLLRANDHTAISLIARESDAVVGHVLFSPVAIYTTAEDREIAIADGLGLAPVAVLPEFQRRGVGKALIEAGLAQCRETRVAFVVVVGDPSYYSRFGFEPASRYRLSDEFGAGDALQILPLVLAAMPAQGGLVRYGHEFDAFVNP